MAQKEDNKILFGIGAIAAAYFLVSRIGSALGIQTKEETQQQIQNEIDNGTKYIVTRTRVVNGQTVTYKVNLQTLARKLYDDMGGNNYLGINLSFVPTSAPIQTMQTISPMDMKTVAMLYNAIFARNLKEDLLHRLSDSNINTPTVQAYLNAF